MLLERTPELENPPKRGKTLILSILVHVVLVAILLFDPGLFDSRLKRVVRIEGNDYDVTQLTELQLQLRPGLHPGRNRTGRCRSLRKLFHRHLWSRHRHHHLRPLHLRSMRLLRMTCWLLVRSRTGRFRPPEEARRNLCVGALREIQRRRRRLKPRVEIHSLRLRAPHPLRW